MATLTNAVQRNYVIGDIETYPVIASDIIYQGAAVGENGSGYSRPLVAGDPFQGFADSTADNSAGVAGIVNVTVRRRGRVVVPVTGASAITVNDGPAVYASDDNTFTLTSTSNSLIGYVSRWISGTTCVVDFDVNVVKAALQA
jgi:hypothetical protein